MLSRIKGTVLAMAAVMAVGGMASVASADTWTPFVIRTASSGSPTTPLVPVATGTNGITVTIDESGEKAGLGTSDYDGAQLGSLNSVSYTRVDAGPKDPYLNIWVTDGSHYAVISPVANMNNTGNYTSNDIDGLDLQTLGFNIYETDFSDLSWLGVSGATRVNQAVIAGGSVVTLADIAGLTVASPNFDPGNGPVYGLAGTGAPKAGYGVNLIFGDTQGNFTTPIPYVVTDAAVTAAVPTPAAAIAAVPLLGLVALKRRRA